MSLDLYGHAYESLEKAIQREDPRTFARRFSVYAKKRNLLPTCESLLGSSISASTAWQIAEVGHHCFSNSDSIKRILRTLDGNFQSLRRQNADKQAVRAINQDIKALKNVQDTKPVWGIKGALPVVLGEQIADDENIRRRETESLPPICFRIRLDVPMLSPVLVKGDRPFVGHENPFCTEKLTGLPLIRPSSLKGQLRHAAATGVNQGQINALFGPDDVDEAGGLKGRVMFLPAYVPCEIECDIIAPHDDRTRRIEPGPITLEVIRPKELILWLQYWPYDLLSRYASGNRNGLSDRLFSDYQVLIKGLSCWFRDLGIGAKTSSGFGRSDWLKVTFEVLASKKSPWSIFPTKANLKDALNALDNAGLKSKWRSACAEYFDAPDVEGTSNAR